ncbi:MAG: hypothetical protein RIS47_1217, partial [Bacteroidota bacterium]
MTDQEQFNIPPENSSENSSESSSELNSDVSADNATERTDDEAQVILDENTQETGELPISETIAALPDEQSRPKPKVSLPKYTNSFRQYTTPIVLALVLVVGVFIGNFLASHSIKPAVMFSPENNKLSALLNVIEENYVDSVSKETIIDLAISDLLKTLDPHSVYIPKEEVEDANAPLEGNFEGIGIQFNLEEDSILVVNTIPGGPSEKVGLMAGDRIVTINDSLFAGRGISDNDVIKNLKGPRGTVVKVGVARHGERKLLSFSITRDKIPLYSVDAAYMASESTGYIKISKFARTTHEEFVEAADLLLTQGMDKLILDLRG